MKTKPVAATRSTTRTRDMLSIALFVIAIAAIAARHAVAYYLDKELPL